MPDNLYRRGRIWWYRVQSDGREIRGSLRTGLLKEAKARLKKRLDEIGHARFHGEERHTWRAAVGKWMVEGAHGVKASTAERYQVSLGQLGPFLDGLYQDEITKKKIAFVVSERKKAGATNATIRRDLTAVSSVLRACVVWQWRDDNPAKEYDRSIIRESRLPRVLPPDEAVGAVARLAGGNLARLIWAARQTGMRQEEVAGLERYEVKLPAKRIDLSKTKTNRARSLDLSDDALGTLSGTPVSMQTRYVFWHGESQPTRYANVASRFREYVRRAVADKLIERAFTFHDLRHAFSVEYLRRGGNIYDLQKHLGHASIKTTEGYLNYLTPEEAERAKRSAHKAAQV